MVAKYFMMKIREDVYGYSRGKCDGMKNELAHLQAALYESENRRWSASDLKLSAFSINSGGQRRNVPLKLKKSRSFKPIPPSVLKMPAFDFDSSGHRRKVPLKLKKKSKF